MSYLAVFTFPPLLTVLNLWWFWKIAKGVYKLLTAKPKAKVA